MRSMIKAVTVASFLLSLQIQSVMGSELKTLSVNEFQKIETTKKLVTDVLRNYEINNSSQKIYPHTYGIN